MTAPNGLVDGLFDDAAVFPPGEAPLPEAVIAHHLLRSTLPELVGPLVLPARSVPQLVELVAADERLAVSLVVPASDLHDTLRWAADEPRFRVAGVEVAGVDTASRAQQAADTLSELLPDGATAALELPRTAGRDLVLDVLAGSAVRAKLRTGGLVAGLFPGAAELAAAVAACTHRGVAFKATAGLHHAVRHDDPATGFAHHGFLNLLLAVERLAAEPGDVDTAARLLSERRGPVLADRVRALTPRQVDRARSAFTSFGTCSVLDPVADLADLGLLAPTTDRIPA